MRLNLDPFNQCTDSQIESALRKVQLWHKIGTVNGLTESFNPKMFSTGEGQLLSLARAMLQHDAQRTALILLDEATSSLDDETDHLIQHLLAEEFKTSTVISVAHRPSAIKGADLVITLDEGEIINRNSSSI
jgi:ATP-binding cassette subfamily C (CFTR/MRP) protein 1